MSCAGDPEVCRHGGDAVQILIGLNGVEYAAAVAEQLADPDAK